MLDFEKKTSERLLKAVATMREACDQAEREAADGNARACQRVLHLFAWDFANASSDIELAIEHADNAHVMAALAAAQTKPEA
jgi:hypothetical protein